MPRPPAAAGPAIRAVRPAEAEAPQALVTAATAADLEYVVHLQKRHADALGFLPRVALAEKIDRGQVLLARENGEPAGFLHHGSLARPEVKVFQAAIQYDARRRGLGLEMVRHLLRRAGAAGACGVSLRCLDFLDANEFWRAAGFDRLTTEPGAKGALNVWVKRLRAKGGERLNAGFSFSSRVHPCPACGVATVDTWLRGARRVALCAACVAAVRN